MHNRLAHGVRVSLVLAALAVFTFPFLTGCDFIDQLIGGGIPGGGTGTALHALMTAQVAQVNASLVDRGLNPDLRPPLMYDFNAMDSLDQYGDPIHKPNYEAGWDFGDSHTRGFEWNDYVTHNLYWEEGTYTVTLTVRENSAYGNAVATAQKTITIGPAWLEIVSLTTAPRTDGQLDVTVVVGNQSHQVLERIAVALIDDNPINNGWTARGADIVPESPLAPGGTYTLKTVISTWTGTLRAISWWCYPVAE